MFAATSTALSVAARGESSEVADKSFAVFGCGDKSYLHFCGAVDELEGFVAQVKGKTASESLKIDGFFFDLEGNTEKIESWAAGLTAKMPVSSIV